MASGWEIRHSFAFFKSERLYIFFIIAGLFLSFSVVVLAIQAVNYDLSYDMSFRNHDRIFRVVSTFTFNNRDESFAISSSQLAPLLQEESNGVESYTRLRQIHNASVIVKEQSYLESEFFYADSGFFKVFSPMTIYGDVRKALASPNSVVLIQSMAEKYFKTGQLALNKIIEINGSAFVISAIIADPPVNCHLRYKALISYEYLRNTEGYLTRASELWNVKDYTYLLLGDKKDLANLIVDFPKIYDRNMAYNGARLNATFYPTFQSIEVTHYDRGFQYDLPTGNIYTVYGLVALIVVVLTISISNYSILVAGLYTKRIKEVGLRMIWGETKTSITVRFLIESFGVAVVGVLCAMIFIYTLQSTIGLEVITNRQMILDENLSYFIFEVVALLLVFCFFSTYYATRIVTATPVTLAIKQISSLRISSSTFQQVLLTVQFAMVHFCLSSIGLMSEQMRYIKNSNPGFPIDKLAILRFNESQYKFSNFLKRETAAISFIENSALSASIPGAFENSRLVFEVEAAEGKENMTFDVIYSDEDFPQTLGIDLIDGKYFSSVASNTALINERAANALGWSSAVGKRMNLISGQPITIVGVFRDFNLYPLRKYEPLAIIKSPREFNYLCFRLNSSKIPDLRQYLDQKLSRDLSSGKVYFSSLTDFFYSSYTDEQNQIFVLAALGLVSVVLCIKGILGMSIIYTLRQKKNYAIRKVFGAMNFDLIKISLVNILKPVGAGTLISTPFVYLFFLRWLEDFEQKTQIDILVLIVVCIAIASVAVLTVLYQTIILARVDPAKTLSRE